MTDIFNSLSLIANYILIPGLTYGSQLALGALGITMIYAILRFSNFAHGELMSFGAMSTILVTWALQYSGITFFSYQQHFLRFQLAHYLQLFTASS